VPNSLIEAGPEYPNSAGLTPSVKLILPFLTLVEFIVEGNKLFLANLNLLSYIDIFVFPVCLYSGN